LCYCYYSGILLELTNALLVTVNAAADEDDGLAI